MTERKLVIFCSAGDAIRLRPPSGLLYAALYAGLVSPFLPTLLQAHGLTPDEFGLALALSTVVRLVSACRPSRRRELNHNDTMPVDGSGPSGWSRLTFDQPGGRWKGDAKICTFRHCFCGIPGGLTRPDRSPNPEQGTA
jgi:hypothetical protein